MCELDIGQLFRLVDYDENEVNGVCRRSNLGEYPAMASGGWMLRGSRWLDAKVIEAGWWGQVDSRIEGIEGSRLTRMDSAPGIIGLAAQADNKSADTINNILFITFTSTRVNDIQPKPSAWVSDPNLSTKYFFFNTKIFSIIFRYSRVWETV